MADKDVESEARAKYSGKSIFTAEEKNRYAELSGQLDIFRRRLNRWKSNVLAVTNVAGPPSGPDIAPTRVLVRGNYNQPGEIVEAGFPSAITGTAKPATLETGAVVNVPLFINAGDKVVVNSETHEYVSRSNE